MAKVVILTGAGISAESGISTFRDHNGLWNNHKVEDVCNFDSLEKNEKLTLEFYDQRRTDLKDKNPNNAHRHIAALKKKYKNDIVIITQNVDNLFEKAGLLDTKVIHLHGYLTEVKCRSCSKIFDIRYANIKSFHNGKCPECDNKLRPNIVFFGESAPRYELLNYHLHDCELLIVIGTSGNVIDINNMATSVKQSILNNLEPNWMINDENFSKIIYDKATVAIDDISKLIEDFFHKQLLNNAWNTPTKTLTLYERLQTAKKLIEEADAILITAGAGIGVDSGLPDFRGNEGLWTAYPPIKRLGLDFKQMESSSLFRNNPKLAWGFYGHRMNLYKNTEPNEGFQILKKLVKSKNDNYFIFTSNVDGHFQKAGFPEDKIYEIHGSINYLQCVENCENNIYPNGIRTMNINMDTLEIEDYPCCNKCNSTMMPNILMFGDGTFNEIRVKEQNKNFLKWLSQVKNSKVIILEIGAGKTIPTIRNFNDNYSRKYENFRLIRINPIENDVFNSGNIGIKGKGLPTIKKIVSLKY